MRRLTEIVVMLCVLCFLSSCSAPTASSRAESASMACRHCQGSVELREKTGPHLVMPSLCPHCGQNFQPHAVTGQCIRIESKTDEQDSNITVEDIRR
jgi:predicted amidophosphoribosyltransferase